MVKSFRRLSKSEDAEDFVRGVLREYWLRGPILRIFRDMMTNDCVDFAQLRSMADGLWTSAQHLAREGTMEETPATQDEQPHAKRRCLARFYTI